jgi:hypothetical protein
MYTPPIRRSMDPLQLKQPGQQMQLQHMLRPQNHPADMGGPAHQRTPGTGGPNVDVMSRLFPNMGMPEGVPGSVPVTPTNTTTGPKGSLFSGQFNNGAGDFAGLRAMGK